MTGVLSDFSEALAKVVADSGPAVVRVEGRQRMPASGVGWAPGIVITAHHVLETDGEVKLGFADGQTAVAQIAGRDPSTDIAVLRTEGRTPVAQWNDLSQLKVGHVVLALGRPGATVRATMGIVAAFGEAWRTALGGKIDRYLQTDLAMYPGFSGGPLVDSAGRVVGINTSGLIRGSSITVPTPTVKRVVETLLAYGKVKRGYLGVGVNPVRLSEGAGQATGLLVNSVEPGSPAEQGGLLLGDVILKLDESTTLMPDDMLGYLAGDRVGVRAAVHVLRGGQAKSLNVTIGERK